MASRTITIDVYLDDFDDEDIRDEYESRGLEDFTPSFSDTSSVNVTSDIEEMFYAFRLGREERAIELARKIAQDVTGRIL